MYDPVETEISFEYLKKLTGDCKKMRFGIVGGWAIFFHVNGNYRKAFGTDYLKSRDIDVFIDSRQEVEFGKIIEKLEFEKAGYFFRYKLIYDREKKKLISEEQSKKAQIFNLIDIFLDVFSDAKTDTVGSWVLDSLKLVKIEKKEGIPVVDAETLMKMKCVSFFEREKFDKELKDACDIYALLLYSGKKIEKTKLLAKAMEKIINRNDLCDFIAENVLKDNLKSSLVKAILQELFH